MSFSLEASPCARRWASTDVAGRQRRCREIGANPIFENAFRIQFVHLVSVFERVSRAGVSSRDHLFGRENNFPTPRPAARFRGCEAFLRFG